MQFLLAFSSISTDYLLKN